jgi:hypothetical protein
VWRLGILLLVSLGLAGCGGVGNSAAVSTPTTTSSNPAPVGDTVQLSSPTVVNVGAGQTVSGIDVAVVPPRSSNPNAQNLGVNPLTGRASASNTGGVIHRGASNRVVLFGPGLNSAMIVHVSGPNDITVANIIGIQATDNTPGLAFTATASGSAALGARTVYLQNNSGDVTAFAGSMEVVP